MTGLLNALENFIFGAWVTSCFLTTPDCPATDLENGWRNAGAAFVSVTCVPIPDSAVFDPSHRPPRLCQIYHLNRGSLFWT